MTTQSPPQLNYADDAKKVAQKKSLLTLYHLTLWLTIIQLAWCAFTLLLASANVQAMWPTIISWGFTLPAMILVALLGSKLHNPFMGVVLALICLIPCAGYFVPISVLMNGHSELTKLGITPGLFRQKH